jgi:hypothetical protein
MAQTGQVLSFSGHQYLRQRLVLSILSGKSVRIDKIRFADKNPGLQGVFCSRGLSYPHWTRFSDVSDYEISLLQLLEKATNGTVIEISVTGMVHVDRRYIRLMNRIRYCRPVQTRNYLGRTGDPRMPTLARGGLLH